jgi:hypothetical protein
MAESISFPRITYHLTPEESDVYLGQLLGGGLGKMVAELEAIIGPENVKVGVEVQDATAQPEPNTGAPVRM